MGPMQGGIFAYARILWNDWYVIGSEGICGLKLDNDVNMKILNGSHVWFKISKYKSLTLLNIVYNLLDIVIQ